MSKIGQFVPLEATVQRCGLPHRVVFRPAIHVEEVRTVPGEPIAGRGNPKVTVHLKDAGDQRYAHRSRHLCPHTEWPVRIITRHDPAQQETSVALQDQQRDWDFLERHRDLVFDNKRVQMADPAWDKVWALAEDIWTFRREIQKPGGNDFSKSCPWSHPVDTLIYGSWCLGGAYALVGLCATLGLYARELAMWGHSAAEVWIDGQWCFVDSIARFPTLGGKNMVRASFAEIRLNPTDPQYGFCAEQQEFYWETCNLSFKLPDNGLWLQQLRSTVLTPQNAMALYPGWADPRFKSPHADRHDLVWGRETMTHERLVLRRGQAFQRRFWLGALAETRALRATLGGGQAGNAALRQVPDNGGDWFIAVNDSVHPIRDLGGWRFRASVDQPWAFDFDLPLKQLREHDYNTLAIGCPGSGNEFLWFGGAGESALPDEPCHCPRV